jgi:hypothetical protein
MNRVGPWRWTAHGSSPGRATQPTYPSGAATSTTLQTSPRSRPWSARTRHRAHRRRPTTAGHRPAAHHWPSRTPPCASTGGRTAPPSQPPVAAAVACRGEVLARPRVGAVIAAPCGLQVDNSGLSWTGQQFHPATELTRPRGNLTVTVILDSRRQKREDPKVERALSRCPRYKAVPTATRAGDPGASDNGHEGCPQCLHALVGRTAPTALPRHSSNVLSQGCVERGQEDHRAGRWGRQGEVTEGRVSTGAWADR